MFTTEHLLLTVVSVALTPFLVTIFIIMALASSGHSMGLREKYVDVLLKIFDWGKRRMQKSEDARDALLPVGELDGHVNMPRNGSSVNLIQRETYSASAYDTVLAFNKTDTRNFAMSDSYEFIKWAMEAITGKLNLFCLLRQVGALSYDVKRFC